MSKSPSKLRAEAGQFCGRTNRREFIRHVGGGFASLALTGLLDIDGFFPNRARHSILWWWLDTPFPTLASSRRATKCGASLPPLE